MIGSRAESTTSSAAIDAPAELGIVLDVTTDKGLLWLEHFGEYSGKGDETVRETHIGTADCENCGGFRECYRLTKDAAGVLVCQDCLAVYDGVAEVREP